MQRESLSIPLSFTRIYCMGISSLLWDLWCAVSVVGIWPRWIEPKLLATPQLTISLPQLPSSFDGVRIAHLSDLHIHAHADERFFKRIADTIKRESPDLILITGDFICHSRLDAPEFLSSFLNELNAPLGIYASLGNHDYDRYLSINAEGNYDTSGSKATIANGFKRLATPLKVQGHVTDSAKQAKPHPELTPLLKQCGIQLLHNESVEIVKGSQAITIGGVGDLMSGQCLPDRLGINGRDLPDIVLSHNPDSLPLFPSDAHALILSGHCHGGQVNLPWFKSRILLMEDPTLSKGLIERHGNTLYVSRGLSGPLQFRWRARPELPIITLTTASS